MMRVSLIIPFYQRDQGILRRAVSSVLGQELPASVSVDIIVIDDGSPISADVDLQDLNVTAPFRLNIHRVANGGVASARNKGLRLTTDETAYIAFLDSDDMWKPDHLAKALAMLKNGNDLYFCDNQRIGHHQSQFALGEQTLLSRMPDDDKEIAEHTIDKDELFSILLHDCPVQLSTTVYRRQVAADLLFNEQFATAGEDMIFLLHLARRIKRASYSKAIGVDCGSGINIYYGSLGWDNPLHIRQMVERLNSHIVIQEQFSLSAKDNAWNRRFIKNSSLNIGFLVLRHLIKSKGNWPTDTKRLRIPAIRRGFWLLRYMAQSAISRFLGSYKPA